jgi:hypothetical protein
MNDAALNEIKRQEMEEDAMIDVMAAKEEPESEDSVSVEYLRANIEMLKGMKEERDHAKRVAEEVSSTYEAQRRKVMEMMEAEELETFEYAGLKVSVSDKLSYRLDPENLRDFISYVGEKYTFEQFVTFCKPNSQSLQSFIKNELEQGAEEIPGILQSEYQQLSVRNK